MYTNNHNSIYENYRIYFNIKYVIIIIDKIVNIASIEMS